MNEWRALVVKNKTAGVALEFLKLLLRIIYFVANWTDRVIRPTVFWKVLRGKIFDFEQEFLTAVLNAVVRSLSFSRVTNFELER